MFYFKENIIIHELLYIKFILILRKNLNIENISFKIDFY